MSKHKAVKEKRILHSHENVIDIYPNYKSRRVNLVPRSLNQEKLVLALQDKTQHVVITTGPAGSGKSYLSILRAIQALQENECKRIMLVRPAVAVENEKHGFLPGDLNQKLEPWCLPLLDILHEFYRNYEITKMIGEKIIELAPLSMMRGRTIKDTFLIADEAQNMTQPQMMMLLTRIGENSKFLITGDIEQSDKKIGNNGLLDLCDRLYHTPVHGISVCEFTSKDIQRHPLISKVIELYSD